MQQVGKIERKGNNRSGKWIIKRAKGIDIREQKAANTLVIGKSINELSD